MLSKSQGSAVLLLSICALALVSQFNGNHRVDAAPGWQLPWPSGNLQKMDGGYSYGCGDHTGVDAWAIDFWYDPTAGGPVAAAAAGTATIGDTGVVGYGRYVDIDHGGGFVSRYAHLSTWSVSNGSYVAGSNGGNGRLYGNLKWDSPAFPRTVRRSRLPDRANVWSKRIR